MFVTEFLDALDLAVPVVGQVKRRQFGDRDFKPVGLGGCIRQGKQHGGRATLGLPNAFHGRNLGGLVLQRVHAMQISHQDLDGNQQGRHIQAGAKRRVHIGTPVTLEPPKRTNARQQKRHGEPRGQQHVREPVRERRVEDHLKPAGHVGLPVDHHKAGRGMHPRVQGQNPEGRCCRARCHQKGGNGVHPLTHPPTPKQHDAQHGGLQKERREHLVGQERPGHVAHRVHEAGPVGAKLKTHGDATHHA